MSGAGIRLFLVICLLSAATFADACDEKACKLISSFMKMLQSIVDSPSFSCYRNEKMTSDGTVIYDGCYVDTTNGAMKQDTGTFTVTDPGVYRLSFSATFYVPSGKLGNPKGWVDLLVDGQRKATSYEDPEESMTSSYHTTISLNILYSLERGQKVKIQWTGLAGAQLHDNNNRHTHFTGERISA